METSIKIAWFTLILIHFVPALSGFAPGLVEKLYGVSAEGDVGILLVHRGILFFAICVTALYAIFDPTSRKLASLIVGISVFGFLIAYTRAGLPAGDLRKIAIVDLIGVLPLIWVSFQAWR